jgi:hypothetical protein
LASTRAARDAHWFLPRGNAAKVEQFCGGR